ILNFADVDQTPITTGDFQFRVKEHDFIQEVNFVSNKLGRFAFTVGGFFMDKVERYAPQVFNARFSFAPGVQPAIYPNVPDPFPYGRSDDVAKNHKKSYAVYAEANYDITDQLTLTVAGRYSWESQLVFNSPLPPGFRWGDPLISPQVDPRGAHHFSKF